MNVGSRDYQQHLSSRDAKELPIADTIRAKLYQLEPSNDWHSLFSYYDLDGDNAISVEEFTIILRRDLCMFSDQISDAEIRVVFATIDGKDLGDIDAEEFAAWVSHESVDSLWRRLQHAIRDLGADGLTQRVTSQLVHTSGSFNSTSVDKRTSEDGEEGLSNLSQDEKSDASEPARPAWKIRIRSIIEGSVFRLAVIGTSSSRYPCQSVCSCFESICDVRIDWSRDRLG